MNIKKCTTIVFLFAINIPEVKDLLIKEYSEINYFYLKSSMLKENLIEKKIPHFFFPPIHTDFVRTPTLSLLLYLQ